MDGDGAFPPHRDSHYATTTTTTDSLARRSRNKRAAKTMTPTTAEAVDPYVPS
jgi:hypothetical protein